MNRWQSRLNRASGAEPIFLPLVVAAEAATHKDCLGIAERKIRVGGKRNRTLGKPKGAAPKRSKIG